MRCWHNEQANTLSLDGEWEFSLPGQTGIIHTPGCWEAQSFPRRIDGPAIFGRNVNIPSEWRGQHVQIQFDAVSYHAEVDVNGMRVGMHTGAWSPFAFDITSAIRPGEMNEITLTVFKPGERFPIRESLAGFLPDVMLMFGGIWQSARLIAFPGAALSDIFVLPNAQSGEVVISATAHTGDDAGRCVARIQVFAPTGDTVADVRSPLIDERITTTLTVPEVKFWSFDHPDLYAAEITLENDAGVQARTGRVFGFRSLTHQGEQLLFNGVPVCLRGALSWGWYPEIICPAPDDATIRDEFRRVRELGFNMVKLCLYVPSPRYFEIADEEGMLLWLELPMWLPEVTPRLRQQAPLEYADILASVHHHPSVAIYSLGCELNDAVDAELLGQLDAIVRERVDGALFCDNSGSGEAYGGLGFDFADFDDYHFYCDLHYFDPLIDHFHRDWRRPRPLILGEFCDADDFRDLDEIAAARGGELPWWLREWNPLHPKTHVGYPAQRERMPMPDIALDAQALLKLSRRQSYLVRKTILEKTRARDGAGGYVVTGIRDTPLSTSAMFDDLGRSKYSPEAFRMFNGDSVLLLGRGRARKWTHGGDRPAPFEPYNLVAGQTVAYDLILAHTGPPASGGTLSWQISDLAGTIYLQDEGAVNNAVWAGRPQTIERIVFTAPQASKAQTLHLTATFAFAEGRQIQNEWPLWIFPEIKYWPEDTGMLDPTGNLSGLDDLLEHSHLVDQELSGISVLITSVLTSEVIRFVHGGGRALLLQNGAQPLPALAQPFWRESIKIIGSHPAMDTLPHDGVVDLQFYGLATDWAFQTGRLVEIVPDATNTRSLLRRLDARHFHVSDYLIETQIGTGRLMASTLRFQGGLGDQPVGLRANHAGRWLLNNMLKYLSDH